jgi:D-alanine-D-alanine ligase
MKIAVLLGGTSPERDVSLVSGIAMARALKEMGHDVEAIDCAYGDQIIEDLERNISDLIAPNSYGIEDQKLDLDRNILTTVEYIMHKNFDLVFNGLHGGYGENGQLQALLEMCHIPYTGSDSFASALGMNKHFSKLIFEKNDIPTPAWLLIRKDQEADLDDIKKIGFPVVVKPNDQGSTVGLTIVQAMDGIEAALIKAFNYSEWALIEDYISGKELTVSILGQQPLPVIEIIPESGLYDYESKYQTGKTRYVCPAQIPDEKTKDIQQRGLQAYNSLNCEDYARADFRMNENGEIFCLEVNTLPGMTPHSLVPKAAKAAGLDFDQLIKEIVTFSLKHRIF